MQLFQVISNSAQCVLSKVKLSWAHHEGTCS